MSPAMNLYNMVRGAYGGASAVVGAVKGLRKEEEKDKKEQERIELLKKLQELEEQGIGPGAGSVDVV